jgi:hypothetical protein
VVDVGKICETSLKSESIVADTSGVVIGTSSVVPVLVRLPKASESELSMVSREAETSDVAGVVNVGVSRDGVSSAAVSVKLAMLSVLVMLARASERDVRMAPGSTAVGEDRSPLWLVKIPSSAEDNEVKTAPVSGVAKSGSWLVDMLSSMDDSELKTPSRSVVAGRSTAEVVGRFSRADETEVRIAPLSTDVADKLSRAEESEVRISPRPVVSGSSALKVVGMLSRAEERELRMASLSTEVDGRLSSADESEVRISPASGVTVAGIWMLSVDKLSRTEDSEVSIAPVSMEVVLGSPSRADERELRMASLSTEVDGKLSSADESEVKISSATGVVVAGIWTLSVDRLWRGEDKDVRIAPVSIEVVLGSPSKADERDVRIASVSMEVEGKFSRADDIDVKIAPASGVVVAGSWRLSVGKSSKADDKEVRIASVSTGVVLGRSSNIDEREPRISSLSTEVVLGRS